jgi:hypothetical protein
VSAIDRPTGADLEWLARRRLDARRRGYDIELVGAGERLRLLLALTGLDEMLVIGGEEESPPADSPQPGVPSA